MAVEKAPVWTFPTKPKRLGRWYGKGPADRSPVGPGPAVARRVSSAMVPVRRSAGRGTWKRTASCERKTDRSATRRFSRSRTVRCARERVADRTDLIGSGLPPVLVSMVRGKGFPRRAPPGVEPAPSQRRKQRRYRWGLDASGRERIWARRGPVRRIVGRSAAGPGQVRRITPGNLGVGRAFAARRRDAISRPAPPPSTTTAASAISAMPAPVWARLLR